MVPAVGSTENRPTFVPIIFQLPLENVLLWEFKTGGLWLHVAHRTNLFGLEIFDLQIFFLMLLVVHIWQ